MNRLDWLRRPIAHRGLHDASRSIIENTSSAVQAAIDKNYAIEVDLRFSGDGEVMVFHDAELDRLTQATGQLGEMSSTALRNIAFKQCADRMQSLGELFDQVAGQVPLVLEIKSNWHERTAFAGRIAAVMADYRGPACVMSFDPRMIAAIRTADPAISRGLVSEGFRDQRYWQRLSALKRFELRHLLAARFALPHFIAYDVNALPALMPWLGQRIMGWPLLTWTVRTPEQRRTAERWADAMIFEGFEA